MSCCTTTYGGCNNVLVQPRCRDITLTQLVLSDEDGNMLTADNQLDGFSLGIRRDGSMVEFEFNRERTP